MSLGAPRMRSHRQQGAPAWAGPAPAMNKDFYLPADGITALDRFNAAAAGVYVTTPRPHVAANDNEIQEDQDAA